MKIFIIILSLIFSNVFADTTSGIKGLVQANANLMGSPSLPLLHGKQKSDFALKPAMISARTEIDKQQAINDGGYFDFSGSGLTLMYHSYLNKKLGWFILGLGSNLSGEAETNFGGNSVQAKNIESQLTQVGGGVSYKILDSKFMPIQFIAGPSITQMNLKQTSIRHVFLFLVEITELVMRVQAAIPKL